MKIKLEYSVERVYQHQSGQTWVVVKMKFLENESEAAFPFQNLEGRLFSYIREMVAAKNMKNIKTDVDVEI